MKKFLIVSLSGLMLLGTSSAAFARHYHRYYNNVPGYAAAPVYTNYGGVYNRGYSYGYNATPGYVRHHHRWF